MNSAYALLVRFNEKKRKIKILILTIFSLAVCFYFFLMFLSKMGNIAGQINYFKRHFDDEINVITPVNLTEIKEDSQYSITKEFQDYIIRDDKKRKVQILATDINYFKFYKPESINEKDWIDFFNEKNSAIVSKETARRLHLKKNDQFKLEGFDYKVKIITDEVFFEKKIVVPVINHMGNKSPVKNIYITLNSNEENKIPKISQKGDKKTLTEILSEDVVGLKHFLGFLSFISIVFMAVALINIALVFKSLMSQNQKNAHVRFLCGESLKIYIYATVFEFTSITLIAFHMAVMLYYLLLPFVPAFFYFDLSFYAYFRSLIICVVLSVFLSFLYSTSRARLYQNGKIRGLRNV